MSDTELDDYRVFRGGLVVYGISASAVGVAILAFVASYIPLLLTGNESNLLSSLFQFIGSGLIVVGIGITGFCAPIALFLTRDDEKRLGTLVSLACILGAFMPLFRQQINSLFRFEFASLLIGTFIFLAQFLALFWLLQVIAARFGHEQLATKTKRLLPWMIAMWVLPTTMLCLTVVFEPLTTEDAYASVYVGFSSIMLLAIFATTTFTTIKLVASLWTHYKFLSQKNVEL